MQVALFIIITFTAAFKEKGEHDQEISDSQIIVFIWHQEDEAQLKSQFTEK